MYQHNIIISNDHAAVDIKIRLLEHLKTYDFNIIDVGVNSNQSVDYPKYALKLAKYLNENKNTRGILLCGSGLGISIAANKIKGIRCMICHSPFIAALAREKFDINVLGMGAKIIGFALMEAIIDSFLKTKFDYVNQSNTLYLDNMISRDINNIPNLS